jgi:hypothetical protein
VLQPGNIYLRLIRQILPVLPMRLREVGAGHIQAVDLNEESDTIKPPKMKRFVVRQMQ